MGMGRQPLELLRRGYALKKKKRRYVYEGEAHLSGDLRDGDLQETHRSCVGIFSFEG